MVEEAVGYRVVRLTAIADHRRGRREQHERIQRQVGSQLVYMPSAECLGRQNFGYTCSVEVGEQRVVENHCAVQATAQRWQLALDTVEQHGHCVARADICGLDFDVCPAQSEICDLGGGLLVGHTGTSDQHKVLHSGVDEV